MNKAIAIAGVNFRTSKLAYLITGILLASVLINTPINLAVADNTENYQPGLNSYLTLLVILFAIFVPALHFRKFMNLGVKKAAYIKGCAVSYVLLAFSVSLLSILLYLTVDPLFAHPPKVYIWSLIDLFGWSANGIIIAFFQQFAFLLLVAVTAHLLTTIQTFWYGWLVDFLIAAILSVFIPIPVLRGALVGLFNLIVFNPNPALHISICLLLSLALYLLSIVPVKHKPM